MPVKPYTASLVAINKRAPTNSSLGMAYWEHASLILVAESLEDAGQQCLKIAVDSWPVNQGWSMHSADVTSIPQPAFIHLQLLFHENKMTLSDIEERQIFQAPQDSAPDLENVNIL